MVFALNSSLSAAADFIPLSEAFDEPLQGQLESLVAKQGLSQAVQEDKLSLALVVISESGHPRLAMINGMKTVYAASLPKIAILLGASVAIEEGRLILDDQLDSDLNEMIRVSCNECATRVLEHVGRDELIRLLQEPEYAFYDAKESGGLWVGKDYGPSAAYSRDPLAGVSHGANAFQAARFYYLLYQGALVSKEQSALMLERLANPGIEHKFVKGLKGVDGVVIHRKSGSWRNFHADSALVRHGGSAYIIVGLTESANGDQLLETLARPLHDLAIRVSQQPLNQSGK